MDGIEPALPGSRAARTSIKGFEGLADDLVLGIDALDEQHGRISMLLDNLASIGPSLRAAAWTRLLSALNDHFRLEDQLMAGPYTPRSIHRRDHDRILSELARASRSDDDPSHVLVSARQWLRSHLKGMDADLAFFLLEPELWKLRLASQMSVLSRSEFPKPQQPYRPRTSGRAEVLP